VREGERGGNTRAEASEEGENFLQHSHLRHHTQPQFSVFLSCFSIPLQLSHLRHHTQAAQPNLGQAEQLRLIAP
jgi:hypothetical protein